jgi:hypothetical protein
MITSEIVGFWHGPESAAIERTKYKEHAYIGPCHGVNFIFTFHLWVSMDELGH